MINKIKKNYKVAITFFVLGIFVSGMSVCAISMLSSSEVFYDNSKSGGSSNDVQGSLEELYERANSCDSGGSGDSGGANPNRNLIAAYTYNSSTCVTGEESSCQKTECYNNKTKGSCPNGTIIKYKVNDTTTKTFHVIHDNGGTMTMQQRENTIYNISWYSNLDDNTKGPLTALSELEEATKDWTNVNLQTYTMGSTNFNATNAYTGCSAAASTGILTCNKNVYTLGKRTARARMITVQEAASLGCKYNVEQSCPNYMNNYLYTSTEHGGTVNDDHVENGARYNYGYWTLSVNSSSPSDVWNVNRHGYVNYNNTTYLSISARAVIVVSK